jgi:tetratricopeptide (TPR) repeat protein
MGAERLSVERLEKAHAALNTEDSAVALANARAWSGDRESAIRLLEEFTASHSGSREAEKALADLRMSPDLRIERLDRLIGLDPYNLALRVERARLLYDAGRYGETLRAIKFIREHTTHEVAGLAEIEQQALDRRKEQLVAVDERRRALFGDPPMYSSATATGEQIVELAKAYTGLGAYDQSIELYQVYLKSAPDDNVARLNYARVLSWDRRYDESQRQYEIVLKAATK